MSSELDWKLAVRVEEDPALAAELGPRFARASGDAPVSVSDLLGLRPAYYRRTVGSPPVEPTRAARLELGRSWHERVFRALPGEGAYEVRVRRGGVAGRIDLWADVPVELKTGGHLPHAELATLRPEHLEQIAMYCALTDRPAGRLVTLAPVASGGVDVDAVDVRVDDPERAGAAMRARADMLRSAVRAGSPEALPRCRWFGRGCELEAARICRCDGSEPAGSPELLDRVRELIDRPDVAERWSRALPPEEPPAPEFAVGRFRDLVYLRRTYYDRTTPVAGPAERPLAPARPLEADVYDRLTAAVEGGPVGEVARLPTREEEPRGEVVGFRGRPYLLRTSRAWSRPTANDALRRYPQYALELGLRAAASGVAEGSVVLGWERAERAEDRVRAFRYRFDPIDRWRAVAAERTAHLRAAIERRAPSDLPACPSWMYDDCPYRLECGCGGAVDRSQR